MVPFNTESATVDGSTAGLNLSLEGFFGFLPVGSCPVGEASVSGCVNRYTAWWIASGVAKTTDAVPSIPVVASSRDDTKWPASDGASVAYLMNVRTLGAPPCAPIWTLCEIVSSSALMSGRSVIETPWKRLAARCSKARRNVCWRAFR